MYIWLDLQLNIYITVMYGTMNINSESVIPLHYVFKKGHVVYTMRSITIVL
jgi:hypothetical protein